jgi:hypothetical protein
MRFNFGAGEWSMKVLVLADDDFHSRWVTFSLASAGHRVGIMAPGTHRIVRLSRHCRSSAPCNPEDIRRHNRSIIDQIETYCRQHHVDWVVPADLPSIFLLADEGRALKGVGVFPLADPELIRRLNDKGEFDRIVRSRGLPAPKTRLLESADQARSESLGFPLMMKPLRAEGGAGVQRVNSRAELTALLDVYGAKFGWPCLAQEFIPGEDIDLSLLADHGRVVAWTIQRRPPGTQEVIEFLLHPKVLEIGSDLIAACNYHGVIHFDMRIDQRTNEPLLIEANPRFWGSLRHSVWSGVNFPALGLALARGEDVSRQFKPAVGPCRDPGLSIRPMVHALLHGRRRPEGWSLATEVGWRCHLSDPLPEIWHRLTRYRYKPNVPLELQLR